LFFSIFIGKYTKKPFRAENFIEHFSKLVMSLAEIQAALASMADARQCLLYAAADTYVFRLCQSPMTGSRGVIARKSISFNCGRILGQ